MLTAVALCRTGSTNAPLFMTTFSPPSPVRTNDISFDARS